LRAGSLTLGSRVFGAGRRQLRLTAFAGRCTNSPSSWPRLPFWLVSRSSPPAWVDDAHGTITPAGTSTPLDTTAATTPPAVLGSLAFSFATGTLGASVTPISVNGAAVTPIYVNVEAGLAFQQSAFNATGAFLGVLLDRFAAERHGGNAGFPTRASRPDALASAYASTDPGLTASASDNQQPRWMPWGSVYGGTSRIAGESAAGGSMSGPVALSDAHVGAAAGSDFRISADTRIGFALGSGTTSWSLADGRGSGRSDFFQAGAYASHQLGSAYVSAALAYAGYDVRTVRSTTPALETLEASLRAQSIGARGEVGYRFDIGGSGLIPYAAAQVQAVRTPAYIEAVTAGPGLSQMQFEANTGNSSRTELGAWTDTRLTGHWSDMILRARAAWVHNFETDQQCTFNLAATPGISAIAAGIRTDADLALVSAAAEWQFSNGIGLRAQFDGEFANRTQTYSGTGALVYAW
jgi:uncharacterized protein with beta-barrel porin domain